jgi:Tfp pilus assembly protein PilF/DNA-binding MarR family transcriptional regulator
MEEGLNYLQTFNPIESKAELLEKTLVGRKDLVDLLEKLVIESATSGNKHQRLIVGPRGSGKTHLLRVLFNRASSKDELKDKLKIAYLCEDEYGISNFLDFILRLFRAFIKWNPENAKYLIDEIDQLKKVPLQDQEKVAKKILLNHIKGNTLLIIVENVGNIFQGIEEKGQRKLRDLIQQYPYFTIIASNQALFQDIQNEDKPFHNFFKITHLKKLTLEQAVLFLKSIAEWEAKTDLLKFIDEPEGRGRINAIYDITGGNHRLLVTFYNFLKVDYKNNLSFSFIKTINDLIPYYQNFMTLLGPQQQKIIQYLCQTRKPSNVKDIAENCFCSPNTISKQMSNLVRLKYVDASRSGKETFYELSEPLLRICFEVKENRGGPVKLFIDFLGNLYWVQEIKKKYMQYHIFSRMLPGKPTADFFQEQLYYKETIKQYFPHMFEEFNIQEFEKSEKDYQVKTFIEELEKTEAYPDILAFTSTLTQKDRYLLLKEASAFGKIGEVKKEIKNAKLLLKSNKKDIDALFLLAEAFQKNGEFRKSDMYFNKILRCNENNTKALNGLGWNLVLQKKYKESEQYFLKVLSLKPDNKYAIEYTGISVGNQGKHQDAYNYFKKLTKLKPDYSEGWRLLGVSQEGLEMIEEAKASYSKAIELDKNNSLALLGIASILAKEGRFKEGEIYIEIVLKNKSEDSGILNTIGEIYREANQLKKAIPLYQQAIEADSKNHHPYFNIVSCRIGLIEIKKALSGLEKALNVAKDINLYSQIIQNLEENFITLFFNGTRENISTYIHESFALIEKSGYTGQFFKAIPQAIFAILIQHEELDLKRFDWIEVSLKETFKDEKSIIVPLKFLNIGIRHLKKREKNALFQFTKEERNTFQKFVLDKIEKIPVL